MLRMIERKNARRLYDRFSRTWRREKRMAGVYGKPGRKPTFNEWYYMHEGNSSMMAQSTPADVQEYLGLDPWDEPKPVTKTVAMGISLENLYSETSTDLTHGRTVVK